MRKCRNIIDLIGTFSLVFNEIEGILVCAECIEDFKNETFHVNIHRSGVFWYKEDDEENETYANMAAAPPLSQTFRNLKKHLMDHFTSEKHIEKCLKNVEKQEEEKSTKSEIDIGLRIVRTCFHLYTKARPFSDFESLLILQHLNDIQIGNINHSKLFPRKFLPYKCTIII